MKDFIINSELINEWDWENNNDIGLYPDQITLGSGRKAWWKCRNGHRYQTSVSDKVDYNIKCPYCSGKKILIGFNDLQTTDPILASEWNYVKNNNLKPTMVSRQSNKKVWWIDQFEHEWEAVICNRTNGAGCPYCSGRLAITGINDLQTLRPDLMQEWNWDKNNKLGIYPNEVSVCSHKKAWWTCRFCGSSIFSSIKERTESNSCTYCVKEKRASMSEIKLYYYLKKYFPDAIHTYSDKYNMLSEIDVYIPSIKCGFEFDGERYHQDIERDRHKDNICDALHINLVRIREPGCPKYDSSCKFIYLESISEEAISNAIMHILLELGVEHPAVNLKDDIAEINNLIITQRKDNSLQIKFPDIAAEWHPTKNGNLTPDKVACNSSKKAWWLCKICGNEWCGKISNRTSNGRGCPECARSSRCIAVYCPELDVYFDSINDAATALGISASGISSCINGRQKTAGRHPETGERLTWHAVNKTIQN